MASALSGATRRTMPRSLVTLRPPTGMVAACEMEPSWKMATSVVSPPRSTSATPSSRSSSLRTASEVASGVSTSSSISTPARCTHLLRFCTLVAEAVTMCVSTSSRTAVMPIGSRTPACPSTT